HEIRARNRFPDLLQTLAVREDGKTCWKRLFGFASRCFTNCPQALIPRLTEPSIPPLTVCHCFEAAYMEEYRTSKRASYNGSIEASQATSKTLYVLKRRHLPYAPEHLK